jgi:hypothetical protein
MSKIDKRTIYWLCTTKFCGALAIDQDGYVYKLDTAPCYRWMADKRMRLSDITNFLKNKKQMISLQKINDEIDAF